MAPTAPSAPAFAPSPVAAAGGGAATMPMAPMTGFAGTGLAEGGPTSGRGLGPAGGTGLAPFMPTPNSSGSTAGDGQDDRKRQNVIAAPVTGATLGGARGARRGAIRPGTAKPINPGVAAGLLGRAAKDAEGLDVAPSTRRKVSKTAARRSQDGDNNEDMFLDEDAWLIDDPGTGVVAVQEPRESGGASAVIG